LHFFLTVLVHFDHQGHKVPFLPDGFLPAAKNTETLFIKKKNLKKFHEAKGRIFNETSNEISEAKGRIFNETSNEISLLLNTEIHSENLHSTAVRNVLEEFKNHEDKFDAEEDHIGIISHEI